MKNLIIFSAFLSFNLATAQHWEKFSSLVSVGHTESLLTSKNEIFILTATNKIYRSNDLGGSWTSLQNGILNSNCSSNTILKESPKGEIFLYYDCFLYKLEGNTSTWSLLNSNTNLDLTDFEISSNNRIYATNASHFYYSENGGIDFVAQSSFNNLNSKVYLFGNNNNFIVNDNSSGTSFTLYSFNDDGSNLKSFTTIGGFALTYSSKTNRLFFSAGGMLHYTIDRGRTKIKIEDPVLKCNKIKHIQLMKNGEMIAICDEGIYNSTNDGLNWKRLSIIPTSDYPIDNSKLHYNGNRIFLWNYSNETFIMDSLNNVKEMKLPESNGNFIQVIQKNQIILVESYDNNWFLSKDNGLNWFNATKTLPSSQRMNGNRIILLPNNRLLLCSRNGITKISDDFAKSWVNTSIPSGSFGFHKILASSTGKLIGIDLFGDLYESSNSGISWSKAPIKLPKSSTLFSDLTEISSNDILHNISDDSLHYSLDLGLTWSSFPQNEIYLQYSFLSKTNTLYWTTRNTLDRNIYLKYTNNFGITADSLILSTTQHIVDDENYFISRFDKDDYISIFNVITREYQEMELPKIDNPDSYINTIYKGKDNHIYLCFRNGGIYRSNFTINTNNYKRSQSDKITIYPNPAHDYINFILHNELKHSFISINILDYNGKSLIECLDANLSLNILTLEKGIYVAIIKDQYGKLHTKSFVVN